MAGSAFTVTPNTPQMRATVSAIYDQIRNLVTDIEVLRVEVAAIGTTLADYKTQFDAHAHTQEDGDGSQTSIPDDTAGGIAGAGTDRVFTDTSTSPAASTLVASNLTLS